MPAVYAIDLIAKRDKKIKMDRSIVKGWNVHYQTLEEVEAEARARKQKQDAEAQKNEENHSEEDGEQSSQRPQEGEKRRKEGYNAKTGAYSGHYGKQPVQDEGQKQQIHAILNEKPEPFESAMSSLQGQSPNGQ